MKRYLMATRNRMQERLEADAKLRKEHGEDIGQSQPPKMINTRASRGLLQAPIDAERQMAALVKEKYGNGTALPCLNLGPLRFASADSSTAYPSRLMRH